MPDSLWVDWVLKAVIGLASIFVFLLGRDVKRSEDAIIATTNRLRNELGLELQLRDQRLAALERGGQKSSDEASKVMVKIADLEHRMTILETQQERS